ncbi:hypothetical protein Smp_156050 [Schistosoma mansoni]|uniref:Uncharacterized protein n=1 Tax=Schistosoma mansoni TaxID=6183 RepID=G4VHU9_SCHMA|nr:hypothetical protein Smp_156050 [Schistosoma mansoni]|eukprot:XP_018651613.1 hypothetical protein Smp_156050 [Schistosoma mansoni]
MGLCVGIGFCILPIVLIQCFFPDSSWRKLAFSLPCFVITVCGGISYFFTMCFSWQLVVELCLLSSLFELLVTVNFSGCLDSVHVTDSLLFQLNKQLQRMSRN